jgi:hypothetical protein
MAELQAELIAHTTIGDLPCSVLRVPGINKIDGYYTACDSLINGSRHSVYDHKGNTITVAGITYGGEIRLLIPPQCSPDNTGSNHQPPG